MHLYISARQFLETGNTSTKTGFTLREKSQNNRFSTLGDDEKCALIQATNLALKKVFDILNGNSKKGVKPGLFV
jgi:hypothetical protein